jgi:two-component system OmpR family response regulator
LPALKRAMPSGAICRLANFVTICVVREFWLSIRVRDYFEASFWGAFQRVDGMIDEVARLTPLASIANFILVVEDDEDEATFLKELLEKHKYRVTVARDGGQAQATFVMRKPDFVILDLILPGESGFEVCQRLKQANATIPVLVLTAVDMPEARVLAERVGSDGYLTKPFDPEELLRQIQGIALRNWEKTHSDQGKDEKRIRFSCRCGKRFKVSPIHRGKTLSCPECGEPVTVPHRV